MTDTHDTNLPEKPVELEEEKKAAEVSEPATTETPAEEIVSEKPVEPVQKLTKEEILAKLKEVVADVENVAKPEIDGLKQSFYKLHNAEQDAARKLFIENGGAAENFVPQTDSVEEEFKNIMSVIKEKRSALTAAMEKLMRKLNRQKELVLETEDYKRPRAPAPSKLLEPWYRARSFTICHNDKLTDELFSRDIVERLRQDFTFLLPYYDYFVTLEGDPDPRDAAPV